MAGIIEQYRDELNHRTCVMWEEAGIQFRDNIVDADGIIPLHAHSYAHVSLCTEGWFDVVEKTVSGEILEYQVAAKGFKTDNPLFNPIGYRLMIAAHHEHTFTPKGVRGTMLCMWPG